MTAGEVLNAFFSALLESTPVVSTLALLLLALYQVFDLRLARHGKDRFIDTIYALTVSMLMFAVIQSLLVRSGQVKEGSALVIAVSTAAIILAGLLVECVGMVQRKLLGPTLVFVCCYVVLYVIISGSDVLGVPDTVTIAAMIVSFVVGFVMIYKRKITEVGFRSVLRSFVVSTALVYSIVFLVPQLAQEAGRRYVIARRVRAIWNPRVQDGMEYAADDVLNFASCSSHIACPIRVASIVLLTIVLSYLTYRTNKHRMHAEEEPNTTASVPTLSHPSSPQSTLP